MYKLNHYGIRGACYNWFKSYLQDRKQFTVIDNSVSSTVDVLCGVPQGSILGPLLFPIYINDFHFACHNAYMNLFADDSNIFVNGSCLSDVYSKANIVCKSVSDWVCANLLTINYSKTCYILFNPTMLDNIAVMDKKLLVSIDNINISRVTSSKFLGITIDDFLSFKAHDINSVVSKLRSINGMFYNRRKFLTSICRRNLYFALVHSCIALMRVLKFMDTPDGVT